MKQRAKKLLAYFLVALLVFEAVGIDTFLSFAQEIDVRTSMTISSDTSDDYIFTSGGVKEVTVDSGATVSGKIDFSQDTADAANTLYNNGTITGNIITGGSIAQIYNNGTISSASFVLNGGSTLNNTGTISAVTVSGGDLEVTGGSIGTISDSIGSYILLSGCSVGTLSTASTITVNGTVQATGMSVGGLTSSGSATLDVSDSLNITGAVSGATINVGKNTNLTASANNSYSVYYNGTEYTVAAGSNGTLLDMYGKKLAVSVPENSHITCSGVSDTSYLPGETSGTITLEAEDGYYFPESYCSGITSDGTGKLTATKVSDTKVTITYTLGTSETGAITITVVEATVKPKKHGTGSIVVDDVYYGTEVKAIIASDTNNIKDAKIEYKKKGAANSKYRTKKPTKTGSYTARVTFAETSTHTSCVATTDFNITYLPIPDDAYVVQGTRGDNGFYVSAVQILPKDGYSVASKLDGTYKDKLTLISSQDNLKLYFVEDETGAKTKGKKLVPIKIDITLPAISAIHGTTYYGETVTVDVSDTNLSEVRCNNASVSVTDGQVQLVLESDRGSNAYQIYAKDLAGNSRQIDIVVADEWMRTGIIPANQLVRLSTGMAYQLGSGLWKVAGDTTQYTGSQEIYVRSGGNYTFGQE